MAKTTFIDLSQTSEELFYKNLQPGDRFLTSSIRVKSPVLSRYKISKLTQKSLLPQISADWALKSDSEKLAWTNAGAECGLNGWRLYVKDKCARIKNGLTGDATPSLLHQVWAGKILIQAPATQIKIVQLHPRNYYIYKKIPGTKSQYQNVLITEAIGLPFTLGCNYKSDFTVAGPDPYAKLFGEFWYSYQGVDLYGRVEIALDFSHDWQSVSKIINSLETILIGYNLYIEIHDLQGSILFDKIKAEHNGQNWCRDTYMQDFNVEFTKQFYQIPKNWAPITMPDGATYDSIYSI
jgi:hypothetical protein